MIENYKGFKIIVEQDISPCNPRENLSDYSDLMICLNDKYELGDHHNYKFHIYGNNWENLKKQLIKDYDPVEILPIYLLDHSGLTISTTPFSCSWDSYQIGFILMSKKNALKRYAVKKITKNIKKEIHKYLLSSVEQYNMYLHNAIYCYYIEDKDGNHIDSLSNCFTDNPEKLIQKAKLIIDFYIENYSYQKHIKDRIVIDNIEKSEIGQKIQERIDELKDGKVKVIVERI